MKCKHCKGDGLPENAVYCCWCGQKLKKDKAEISVPKPKKKKDGTYTAQIMVGGKRVMVPPQLTEAKYYAVARAMRMGAVDVKDKPENMTLSEAIDKYAASRSSRLKTTSKDNYDYIKRCRFKTLMPMKIADITPEIIEAAVEAELKLKSRKGGTISPGTVNDAYHLISTVLQKYAHMSPGVDKVEEQDVPRVVLPPEQIYPAVMGTDMELPALLAMWLGMSASEIRGLTKSRSIINGKLYMTETVVRTANGDERRKGGKEEKRPRVYDIPPHLAALIDAVDGDIIEPRTAHALNQRLQTLIKKAGLPKITFHSLRHTSASVMVEENIPDKYAQERGGWKTDEVMKKTYQHTFDSGRKQADEVINKRFEALLKK